MVTHPLTPTLFDYSWHCFSFRVRSDHSRLPSRVFPFRQATSWPVLTVRVRHIRSLQTCSIDLPLQDLPLQFNSCRHYKSCLYDILDLSSLYLSLRFDPLRRIYSLPFFSTTRVAFCSRRPRSDYSSHFVASRLLDSGRDGPDHFRLFDSDRHESTAQVPALSFRFEPLRLLISCPGQVSSTSLFSSLPH